MAELFKAVFSRYAEVRSYPKFDRVVGYQWCIYCDLNPSFDFLLSKPKEIPDWVLKDESLFLSFLAGYFDAEGCIGFSSSSSSRSLAWVAKSCDYEILKSTSKRLNELGMHPSLRLERHKGEPTYNHDYWGLFVSTRAHVIRLLDLLPLRHPEKVAKSDLARRLASTGMKEGWNEVKQLRLFIRSEVSRFKSEARAAMLERGRYVPLKVN